MKRLLHHLFIPHESNNFKAKILHHKSLLILIICLLFTSSVFSAMQKDYSAVLGISAASVSIPDLLTLTNQKRAENHLQPLTMSRELTVAAGEKAKNMFAENYWAHNSPDGLTPWVFIKNANYQYIYAGENLARGFGSAQSVVDAWMASPGHRENLLSPNYKEIGFAVMDGNLTGEDTVLVVQMFGSRATADVATANTGSEASPTPIAVPTVSGQVVLQSAPSPTIPVHPVVSPVNEKPLVEAVQSKPLINKKVATKHIAVGVVVVLLIVLILDIIFIEEKRIKRSFTHTLDHVIFLTVILIAIFIITKGAIL